MTHSTFGRIPVAGDTERAYIEAEIGTVPRRRRSRP